MVQSVPLQTHLFKQIFASSDPKGKGKGKQKATSDNTLRNVASQFNWEATARDLRSFIESHTALADNSKDDSIATFIDNQNIEFHIPSRPLLIEEQELDSLVLELEQATEESVQQTTREVDTFDRDWLLHRCSEYIQGSGSTAFTDTTLCTDLFTILRSKESADKIQDNLIDLLGYESLDFVSELILNRDTIVQNIMSQVWRVWIYRYISGTC
ncbi:hypothetical protein BGW37DRAFT_69123 [Umbelopsis sp. PMI_123]|nr:hypothetical protein BGW37DRAFT_69123 [Umbelopsis sp. PMI_123]